MHPKAHYKSMMDLKKKKKPIYRKWLTSFGILLSSMILPQDVASPRLLIPKI